ncbi:MAG: hypothetical protein WD049_03110, partial [Candidatus Paceibacterota bacterium]
GSAAATQLTEEQKQNRRPVLSIRRSARSERGENSLPGCFAERCGIERVHAQAGRDARAADQAGLSDRRLRQESQQRTAAGHAGDRKDSTRSAAAEPEGRIGRRPHDR